MDICKIWSEWDIGVEDWIFFSRDEAKKAAREAFELQDFEDPFDEMWGDLIGVEVLHSDIPATPYMLVGDDSGHEYVIPADKENDWHEYLEDEENLGDDPPYAQRVEGRLRFYFPET